MMTELMCGNPQDTARLPKEQRVYELLDSLGVEYHRVDHGEAATIEACLEIEGVLGCEICKNLFLKTRNGSQYYLLLMPGAKQFKTKVLSKEIGSSRLSFAEADEMLEYLDITPGSVSVLGLMNDKGNKVRLLIDREVLAGEYIGCHPCINTSSLRIKTSDLVKKIIPAMGHPFTEVILAPCEEE